MATEIKEVNGMLKIIGSVNASNCYHLKKYLEYSLLKGKGLLLSIENVMNIDASGAFMLENLYKRAGLENFKISIFGQENKHIHEIMNSTNTRYILSNDRA